MVLMKNKDISQIYLKKLIKKKKEIEYNENIYNNFNYPNDIQKANNCIKNIKENINLKNIIIKSKN